MFVLKCYLTISFPTLKHFHPQTSYVALISFETIAIWVSISTSAVYKIMSRSFQRLLGTLHAVFQLSHCDMMTCRFDTLMFVICDDVMGKEDSILVPKVNAM